MKKYFYSLFAAAALILSATSCSQEEDFPGGNGQEVDVTFAVKTSDAIATRAIAEGVNVGGGNMANHLIYAVYESGKEAKALIQNKVEETTDGVFKVTVPLVKGIAYDIVFFAYNEEGNAFGITSSNYKEVDLTDLTLNETLLANQEAYDAFYAVKAGYKAGANSETVYLNRPFAQLNVGTTLTDLANAADLDVLVAQSSVSVKGIFNKFNARTGKTSGDVALTYALSDVLKKTGNNFQGVSEGGETFDFTNEKFNVSGKTDDYYYLALAYILAESPATLNEVSVSFFQDGAAEAFNTITVPSLTLQRNWRTNIIGNLLTSSNSFEIVIDEEFDGDHNYEVWDGKSIEAPKVSEDGKTYIIENASQFASLSGKTLDKDVEFAANIDMGGYTFLGMLSGGHALDGKGYTLSNVTFDYTSKGQDWSSLFVTGGGNGSNSNIIVKNLTVDGANVIADKTENGNAAVIASYAEGTVLIENVIVKNSKVNGTLNMGALVGLVTATSETTIKNCAVENTELTTFDVADESGNVGTVAGRVVGKLTVENTSVAGSTINAYINRGESQRAVSKYIGNFYGGGDKAILVVTNGSIDDVTVNVLSEENKDQVCQYGDFLGGWQKDGGTVTINGVEIAKAAGAIDTVEELAAALTNAQDGDVIGFSGNIELTELKATSGVGVTIVGLTEDARLDFTGDSNYSDCAGNLTFKNVNFKFASSREHYSVGLHNQGGTHVYENCSFEGIATAWGDCTYTGCEFVNTTNGKYAAWVYAGTVVYDNCTFTGVNRAAKVFNENADSGLNVTYNNCTFNASNAATRAVAGNKTGVEVAVMNNTNAAAVVVINNAKLNGMGNAEHYGNEYFNIEYLYTDKSKYGNAIVTVDGETHAVVCKEAVIKQAMNMNSKNITMMLCQGASLNNGTSTVWGGAATETIKIGSVSPNNDKKYTLTLSSNYRDYIQTAGAKVVLEGVKLATVTTKGTHWHDYAPKFTCNVDMNGVDMLNSFCFEKTAVLKNITVIATWPTEVWAMWITSGADVTIDGMTVETRRGIKITDEDAPAAKTILNVSNATFKTSVKAAILATTKYGADITLSNVDIKNVEADTENEVWVDEERAEYADLVTVTGGDMKIEGDGYRKANDDLYVIWNADGMKWFANEVNTSKNSFSGKTVKLMADIDLNNEAWTPVGQTGATLFQGTFDGQNHTIKNLNIDSESQTGANYSSGLFGWGKVNGFTVKNVTVDGATVKGHHNVGVIVGYYYGTVDNCHVKNAILNCTKANDDANGDKCGAIAGYVGEATSKLTNCTAVDCSISAGRDAGQIAGAAVSSVVVNCSATRVAVTSNGTSTGAYVRNELIGRILQ